MRSNRATPAGGIGLGHFGWLRALELIGQAERCDLIALLGLGEVSVAVAEAVEVVRVACPEAAVTGPDSQTVPLGEWVDEFGEAPWGPGMAVRYGCLLVGEPLGPPEVEQVPNVDDLEEVWSWHLASEPPC